MADMYQIITDRIVRQLESGTVPWHKPWTAGPHGWPKNFVSWKEYRGINVMLLCCSPYEMPYWVSFKQAKSLGGHVRKGEKSTPVVFWKWYPRKNRDGNGDVIRDDNGKESKSMAPILRYYNVFNVAQCDGLDDRLLAAARKVGEEKAKDFEPIAECERIVAGMPERPAINHGTIGAFYRAADDTVNMPYRERPMFTTMFHDLRRRITVTSRL